MRRGGGESLTMSKHQSGARTCCCAGLNMVSARLGAVGLNEDAVEVSKQVVDVIDVRESCWRDVGSLPARELA